MNKMWPIKLDMTQDECRSTLRRLELESYSSVVSVFRAQGTLCQGKSLILEELQKVFHISTDRHKAEARRVANDEKLGTIAEILSGPNSNQEWIKEGRRLYPILPRTAPYTALTYLANTLSDQISKENCQCPHPFETSRIESKEANDDIVKPVVVSDPMQIDYEIPTYSKKKQNTHKSYIEDENFDAVLQENPFSITKRSQLFQQLQSPQKPAQHTNNQIQKLYQTHYKPQTGRQKKTINTKKRSTKAVQKSKIAGKALKSISSRNKVSKLAMLKNTSLIHSYASPALQCGSKIPDKNIEEIAIQPEKHLMLIRPNFQHHAIKAQLLPLEDYVYNSQQILPSSKKDIQYNLNKLNMGHVSGNVTEPSLKHEKSASHELMPPSICNEKLPSSSSQYSSMTTKVGLSPAVNASNILHRSLTREDNKEHQIQASNVIVRNELDDVTALSAVQQKISSYRNDSQIPDPKVIFSTTVNNIAPSPNESLSSNVIFHKIEEIKTQIMQNKLTATNTLKVASPLVRINTLQNKTTSPIPTTENKVTTVKPTLGGFTPIKGTNKMSVHKLQLKQLNQLNSKNTTIQTPNISLNPGQKITFCKSSIISHDIKTNNNSIVNTTCSPNEQVQKLDLNNIVVFDICPTQKFKPAIVINNNIKSNNNNQTVITEDTPVDLISSTVLDAEAETVKPVKCIIEQQLQATEVDIVLDLDLNNSKNNQTLTSIIKPSTSSATKNINTTTTTDWELELDQANQKSLSKMHGLLPKNITINEQIMLDDEQHFNAVIEEDDLVEDETVKIVDVVSYDDSSNDLIADLEGDDDSSMVLQDGGNIVVYNNNVNKSEINPTSLNFAQYIDDHIQSNGQTIEADINMIEEEIIMETATNEHITQIDAAIPTQRVAYSKGCITE